MARTIEEIRGIIKAAKDSVWVVEDAIQRLTDGATADKDLKDNIQRNVDHLKHIVADEEIVASGENLSELTAGIAAGEAKLAENIWVEE